MYYYITSRFHKASYNYVNTWGKCNVKLAVILKLA